MNKNLRDLIGRDEYDYQMLMSMLSGYAKPRDRVTSLLRKGEIVRVKKGLYVFAENIRREPLSRELLANLIFGPSAVSLDSALSFYGLIPERVEAVTSVTTGRAHRFETPLGLFIYRPTPSLAIGIEQITQGNHRFLMALPERALADRIRSDRTSGIRSQIELERYLAEDLRIDLDEIKSLNVELMDELAVLLGSRKLELCARLIQRLRRQR